MRKFRLISRKRSEPPVNGRFRLVREKQRLRRGERPKPVFSDRQQRSAARLLAGFFVMMLVLTFLSRTAVSLTLARVTTGTIKSGVLTQRYSLPGVTEAQNTMEILLPGGLLVSGVTVQAGDYVEVGDEILRLDLDGVQSAIEQMESEIQVLDGRMKSLSAGSGDTETESLQRAENNLKYAREDYARLIESQEASRASGGVSGGRAEEDLRDAQIKYGEALNALEDAKRKAREERLTAAQKAFDDAEYNRAEAVSAAQAAADRMEAAADAADMAWDSAAGALNRAKDRLEQARAELRLLLSQEPPAEPEEIAAAEAAVDAAEEQVYSAQLQADAAGANASDEEAAYAREEVKRIKKRHNQLVEEAEAALTAALEQTDVSGEPLVVAAQAALDSAQSNLKAAVRSFEDAGLSREERLRAEQTAIESAKRAVESAETELEFVKRQSALARQSGEVLRQQNETEKLQCRNERRQKESVLEQLKALDAQNGILTAPISGTVKLVSEAGMTQEGQTAVRLSRSDQGFQFAAKVEPKVAEQLAAGDAGNFCYTSGGTRRAVSAQVASVGTPGRDGQVRITVQLTEDGLTDGIVGAFELEKSSERYPMILPVSALRLMGGRTVVLVVRETQSAVGAEQIVEEVEVVIKDQDTENAAVEGALFPDDRIVVNSSKPLRKGDRVCVEN